MKAKRVWHMQRTNVPVEDENVAELLWVQDFDVLVSRVFIKHDFIDIILYEPAISCWPVPVHLSASLQCRKPEINQQTNKHIQAIYLQPLRHVDRLDICSRGAEYRKIHHLNTSTEDNWVINRSTSSIWELAMIADSCPFSTPTNSKSLMTHLWTSVLDWHIWRPSTFL